MRARGVSPTRAAGGSATRVCETGQLGPGDVARDAAPALWPWYPSAEDRDGRVRPLESPLHEALMSQPRDRDKAMARQRRRTEREAHGVGRDSRREPARERCPVPREQRTTQGVEGVAQVLRDRPTR